MKGIDEPHAVRKDARVLRPRAAYHEVRGDARSARHAGQVLHRVERVAVGAGHRRDLAPLEHAFGRFARRALPAHLDVDEGACSPCRQRWRCSPCRQRRQEERGRTARSRGSRAVRLCRRLSIARIRMETESWIEWDGRRGSPVKSAAALPPRAQPRRKRRPPSSSRPRS